LDEDLLADGTRVGRELVDLVPAYFAIREFYNSREFN
jgi:hypothetical protein